MRCARVDLARARFKIPDYESAKGIREVRRRDHPRRVADAQ
jgi:hypothetical protein